MTILLDTDFLFAQYNNKEPRHGVANQHYTEIINGKYNYPVLLDYVFDELMTLIQTRGSNEIATIIGSELLDLVDEEIIIMYHISSNDFLNAWELFSSQTETNLKEKLGLNKIKSWQTSKKSKKFLSFTDCVLIEVSKVLKIANIASFDRRLNAWVSTIPQ